MRIKNFHCVIGTKEEFLASMRDLMRLQEPIDRSVLTAATVAEIRNAWVVIELGSRLDQIPPRVAHGGRLSSGHAEVLHRLLAWHQPRTARIRRRNGNGALMPEILRFAPGSPETGHEAFEAADRLILFMRRTGSSAATARRQVLGEPA